MADSETLPTKDEDDAVPLNRVIAALSIFGVWCIIVSFLHALWSAFDVTSAVVAVVAAIPVLAFVFRNIELSYGDKKAALTPTRVAKAFRDVDSLELRVAAKEVSSAISAATTADLDAVKILAKTAVTEPSSLDTAEDDVVFVRLRREIERRLNRIASSYGLSLKHGDSSYKIIGQLEAEGVINYSEASGLRTLIRAGNAQVRGARTNTQVADLARTEGDRLLGTLDALVGQPESALEQAIVTLAQRAGKTPYVNLRMEVAGSALCPDIVVPGEVVLEIKSRYTPVTISNGIAQLGAYVKAIGGGVGGILVLGSKPGLEGETFAQQFESQNFGLAWLEDNAFAGNETAKRLAPWLFTVDAS